MKTKLIIDISASSLQVIISQLLGIVIFLVTSKYLDKSVYGELNWSLAIFAFITTILGMRLDQVVVHKVAAREDASQILSLFVAHVVFAGLSFYFILVASNLIFPSFYNKHQLLLTLSISQLFNFFSTPFKQVANGKERFGYLAAMSSVSNLIRSIWLLAIVVFSTLTIQWVLIIFIISALAELLYCMYVTAYHIRVPLILKGRFRDYQLFLKDSLPQIGAAFLNAGIARMDWIILGLMASQAIIAEYSFAYKVFELSPLPMLIVAPVLLSRFARYFRDHSEESLLEKKAEISLLIRMEMILATFLPMMLILIWTPLIDSLTNNKYGAVNQITFLLLSLCIPFQYMINLIWTIHFTQKRLVLIFKVTTVTCLLILVGDVLLIHWFQARGAAIAYLIAIIVEYVLFLRSSQLSRLHVSWSSLITCIVIAFISGFTARYFLESTILQLITACLIYAVLALLSKQVRQKDFILAQKYLSNSP